MSTEDQIESEQRTNWLSCSTYLHAVDKSLRTHIARTDKQFKRVNIALASISVDETIAIRSRIDELSTRLQSQIMRVCVLTMIAQYVRQQNDELLILRNAINMLDLPDQYWIGQAASARTIDAWAALARVYDHVRDYDRMSGRG